MLAGRTRLPARSPGLGMVTMPAYDARLVIAGELNHASRCPTAGKKSRMGESKFGAIAARLTGKC